MKRRRIWLLPLILALLIVAAAATLWVLAERRMMRAFDAWAAAEQQQGWTVRHGAIRPAGGPLAVAIDVAGLSITGGQADLPGGLDWRAQRVTVLIDIRHPHLLHIRPAGRQVLRLGTAPAVPFTAAHMDARIPLAQGQPAGPVMLRSDALAIGPVPGTPLQGPIRVAHATLAGQGDAAATSGQPALTFTLAASDILLPPGRKWPLGPRVARLDMAGTLTGPVPPGTVPAVRAAAWRDGGGKLVLRQIGLAWSELHVQASATLGLDATLQPTGAATARITGQSAALDTAAANGALTHQAATAAKAVLALMAQAPAKGGTPALEVPLRLQDRTLEMGQFPLLRLPALVWPAPDAGANAP
ncbi:MAG TPA: DUF2125 domain-containing protein [Acetobacteraceae bacterium]|nr:DUF2125 domain-containing protein [Acetobacteraceae bacterium]